MEKKTSLFNILILMITSAVIAFTGFNVLTCSLVFPGSIRSISLKDGKNPPLADCENSERRGYETLLTVLTTLVALKAKLDD